MAHDRSRANAARRAALAAFEARHPESLRYATTPQLIGFLFDRLTEKLAFDRCEHLQPDQAAPRFAVLALPGRIACHLCRQGLLLSIPVEHDGTCDRCEPPLTWGELTHHSVVIGQLTIFLSLCDFCCRDLGIEVGR
jgi:hypothetical protein